MKSCVKFIFMTGDIVISKNNYKNFDNVKILNKNIFIEPGQKGPVVCIYNNKNINSVHTIPDTQEFMKKDPFGTFSKYIALLKNGLK